MTAEAVNRHRMKKAGHQSRLNAQPPGQPDLVPYREMKAAFETPIEDTVSFSGRQKKKGETVV